MCICYTLKIVPSSQRKIVHCTSINKFDNKISSHTDVFTPNEWRRTQSGRQNLFSFVHLHLLFHSSCLPLLLLSLALTPIHLLHGVAVFVYRIPHKQHSTMNNRMLLKAFKTISKVVLFHTKYLWCSCVFLLSSVYLTVLEFSRAACFPNVCVLYRHGITVSSAHQVKTR